MNKVSVPVLAMVRGMLFVWPTLTLPNSRAAGDTAMIGAIAVPVKDTVAGLPEALWLKETAALLAVALCNPSEGLKFTVTVFGASPGLTVREAGVTENNPASGPLSEMVDTDSGALPVLPTVKLRIRLAVVRTFPKERESTDSAITGSVPVPDSATVDGLPKALCAIDNEADFAPAEAGVKVTVTVWGAAPALTVKLVGLTL
jgi:hypothetical protein